ncbi:MAG: phospholipid carrier-dependent glycosyltransferase, partial [Planctomycetes bacterium]|nr:phospholipid carrier-dependent glycosyltransferase [Planctomycetota bacterium]
SNPARFAQIALMLCLVTALVLQALGAALDKSATWDEPGHLTRGAWILAAGDYGLEFLHPPLAQTLAAALVRLVHAPQVPDDLSQRPNITAAGHAFVWMANPNGHQLIFTARLTTMFLSVVGAILVCLWATELYGWGAGGLALFLYCFCPNIIAHSAVITTDLSCTVFSLAACYAYWRFSQRRSCGRLLALGAALGLALASKYSALFLLPALAAAEVLRILSVRPLTWSSCWPSSLPPCSLCTSTACCAG